MSDPVKIADREHLALLCPVHEEENWPGACFTCDLIEAVSVLHQRNRALQKTCDRQFADLIDIFRRDKEAEMASATEIIGSESSDQGVEGGDGSSCA